MIFADSEAEEQAAYDTLGPLQRDDFVGIFQAMDGKPVTVRLLDPPLHGSCPTRSSWPWPSPWPRSRARRTVEVGGDEWPWTRPTEMLAKVGDLRGQPDAGAAGVRLGILKPGCTPCRSGPSSRPRPRSRPTAATRSWRS